MPILNLLTQLCPIASPPSEALVIAPSSADKPITSPFVHQTTKERFSKVFQTRPLDPLLKAAMHRASSTKTVRQKPSIGCLLAVRKILRKRLRSSILGLPNLHLGLGKATQNHLAHKESLTKKAPINR